MRSTQFDDHSPFDEKPEEHHERNQPDALCEAIKRLGYARNNRVRLYGEVFDLISDPISVGETEVFVDAVEWKSGQVRRVRIPSTIVQIARINRRASVSENNNNCCKIAITLIIRSMSEMAWFRQSSLELLDDSGRVLT